MVSMGLGMAKMKMPMLTLGCARVVAARQERI